MAKFFYRGKTNGGITQGSIEARGIAHAAQLLEHRGIGILEIKEIVSKTTEYSKTNLTQFSVKEKKEFFNSFYFQYKAGLSIIEVFNVISSSSTNENVKSVAYHIASDIKKGSSLDLAIRKYSHYIGDAYAVLVGTGEKTGKLDSVLEGIIKNINLVEKIKTNVLKKSTYPAIVLCLAIGAALFFSFFVFAILDMLYEPPSLCKIISMLLVALLKIAVIFAIGFVCIYMIVKNKKLMYSVLNFFTKFAFLKPIFNNYYLYNFFHILSLSYSAGLDINKAVSLSCEVVNSNEIKNKLAKAQDLIANGCELTTAFGVSEVFSEYAISQLSAGEKSGALSDLAETIALDYENNLNIQIDTLLKFIEPILLLLVGVMVLLVMAKFITTYYSKLFSIF